MRFRHRGKRPNHVVTLINEIRDLDEDEMEKYAENAKRELFEWVDMQVGAAVDAHISVDETCATLLGIVLEKSYAPLAALPAVDVTDPEWEENFSAFSHAQGHKMIELFAFINITYIDKLAAANGDLDKDA